MKLSIVIATLNRLALLKKCLASIGPACGNVNHEIVIVDGGSVDGTLDWLRGQDILLIEQGKAWGAVAAYNAGFLASDGEYVANLNDECELTANALANACLYLDNHPHCGQVAIHFTEGGYPFALTMHIGKQRTELLYANFGVTRRELGDLLGWWGNYLTHYGGDCELSAQIWRMGYSVEAMPVEKGYIIHHRAEDGTRRRNSEVQIFMERWGDVEFTTIA